MTVPADIWAVVPVKEFAGAKQRLSAEFPPAFRQKLAITMLEDVLDALAHARHLAGIAVVTVDADAEELALRYGARVLVDEARSGHTGAVTAAARLLSAEHRGGMLSMPGDIPGATSAEIDHLLESAPPPPGFAIVPAHDWRGSNAVLCMPPDVMTLAFGNDSFLPHVATARGLGFSPVVVPLEGIGMDVDNPQDLRAFARKPWRTRTRDLLAQHGLLTYPATGMA